ncbi:UDP-glucose 4-epimerase GalE [Aureimonas leprariae]|uniref:UDP-glucose 4-epimerase n=1 Tax=Plantimonas leprariae TaxID=2615207 RepID=A0A7V7TYN9_9HYPH|nr:UDP-glucose 4-epimerase GalE [Aureimonas leprariae]KAB0682981.1 UDP-glucose 4-epimerase GalE [Aureimonas leprariae]
MSVLVTGGGGYIGSHMVLGLVDRGEDVVVLDNFTTGFDWLISPAATVVQGDVADGALVGKLVKEHEVDAIVHFAGSIVVPDSVRDPLGYYLNNTARTRDLIAAAVASGVPRFIFSSTAAVYGEAGSEPVREDARLLPLSPYGRSKLMSEMMLEDASAALPLNYAALRYFNVAGADPDGRSGQSTKGATHLIKVANEVVVGKRPFIEMFGTDYATPDGTAVRDYIHVTDLIGAHLAALDHLRAGNGNLVANVGYSRGFSVREVLEVVGRVSGAKLDIRVAPRRAGDSPSVVADSTKLRTSVGWVPKHDDLDSIVADALRWERHLLKRNAS